MLKHQFKTQCKGDSHSSKTANIILPGLALAVAGLKTEYRSSSTYIRLLIITMTERIMHSEKKTCRIYQTNKKNEQQLILVMNVSTFVYTAYYVQWNYYHKV